jgi:ABC-2 type transport system permease protein
MGERIQNLVQRRFGYVDRTLSITRKTLLELLREPLLLGLMLLFPPMLVGFYYIAFGQTESGLATYLHVLVVNEDAGVTMTDGTSLDSQDRRWQASEELIEVMRETEYEGQPVFDVAVVTDRRAAEIALRERKASLLLAIPPDFTQAVVDGSAGVDRASPAIVSLVGDPGADSFVFARSFIEGLLRQFTKQVMGWQDDTLTVAYEFLPGTGTMSDFDFGVGGVIVFGIMFTMISTATVLVRENVMGTLRRLRLTRVGASDLLLGATLAQMVAAAVQIPITFGAAVAMGFRSNGSLLLVMGIGLLLSLSAVGLGLIIACFARNDGEAANLGAGALVPMVFLSGALYPMPDVPIMTIAGRTIQIYDILPATHASEAMRRVLVFGKGPGAIAYELVAMTLLSVSLLAMGAALYQRLQMRKP